MSVFIIPELIPKILRGETPTIVEVTHDPYRGWLSPEYSSVDECKRLITNLAWVLLRAYPKNPHKQALIPISLGLK